MCFRAYSGKRITTQAQIAAAHILATVLADNQQSKEVLLANCNAGSQSPLQMPDSSTAIFVVTLKQAVAWHADETGQARANMAAVLVLAPF